MEYIHGTDDFQLNKESAVTLGKFDGIHTGHQKLIEIVRQKADEENLLAVLFTFDSCHFQYVHRSISILYLQAVKDADCVRILV